MNEVALKYEELMRNVRRYITKTVNLQLIERAYKYASERHNTQYRKSGEPYIIHPLEVALILTSFNAGPSTIAAGLLHDVIEDTSVTHEEMEQEFGTEITSLVDGVSKLGQLKYVSKEQALAQNHQKMFLAMAKDIRVIIIKLADRLHNMRTLKYMPQDKQVSTSQETIEIFVPIAHRLGMYRLKSELEDRCLRYINSDEYYYVASLINEKQKEREQDIANMIEELTILLNGYGIEFEIKGRVKNIYSVHKKMREKNIEFTEIFDLLALRLIVNDDAACYHVLGVIHSNFKPIPKRFKDYIAMPKPNMYQSLHTTVIGPNGKIFEVQIRTEEMDNIAEFGVAAHWAYKENRNNTAEQEQLEIQQKLKWYKEMVEHSENDDDASDIVDIMKDDIFLANVYVFTPNGDVLDFPAGATPLDFAYRIHSEIGNKTVGAIVNGKIVPLTYGLKTGDVVEIKTSKNFNGPNEAWLKIVKTSHARHKIIAILNHRKRDQLILRGKDEFSLYYKGDTAEFKLSDKLVQENFSKYSINNIEDFYYEIGKSNLSAHGAYNKLAGEKTFDESTLIQQINENEKRQITHKTINDFGIIIDGLDKAKISMAHCCHPIMGDEIIGYVSKGSGIVIHRKECHNTRNIETERYIDVLWDDEFVSKGYETLIHILSYDRKNIIADLINVINSTSSSLLSISSTKNKSGDLLSKFKIKVKDLGGVQNLIANLYKVADVYDIDRVIK